MQEYATNRAYFKQDTAQNVAIGQLTMQQLHILHGIF